MKVYLLMEIVRHEWDVVIGAYTHLRHAIKAQQRLNERMEKENYQDKAVSEIWSYQLNKFDDEPVIHKRYLWTEKGMVNRDGTIKEEIWDWE